MKITLINIPPIPEQVWPMLFVLATLLGPACIVAIVRIFEIKYGKDDDKD